MLINDGVLASERTWKIWEKKKKNTLLVTIFFTTKNIFILNIYVMYVFLNVHIDDYHFSNITKLKKKSTKTAQALPQQGFSPFFPHHNAYSSKRAPSLSIHVCNDFGGWGWAGMGDNSLFYSQ